MVPVRGRSAVVGFEAEHASSWVVCFVGGAEGGWWGGGGGHGCRPL